MSEHMSVAEAAERLGLREDEVRARLQVGLLRGVEVDGEQRVDALSVLEALRRDLSRAMDQVQARPAPTGSIVVAMVLPMALALWMMASMVLLLSLRDGAPFVPPGAWLVGSWAGLAGLAALARADGQLQTVNGLGVTLYGRRPEARGPVGTAWLVAVGVPLAPVRSYVVHDAVEHEPEIMSRSTSYRLEALDGLCWPQVAPVLAGVWGALLLASAAFVGAFG